MKMKTRSIIIKTFLLVFLTVIIRQGYSQSSLDELVNNALTTNKSLISAHEFYNAEIVESKTGNSPDNPEIEYAYLWGDPTSVGNRIDFAITQSFDFPTAYSSRNKLSKIKRQQAGLRYSFVEQNVIINTRQLWVQAVYLNKMQLLLKKRLGNAEMIAIAFQRMFDEGETNVLKRNQAKLQFTALSNEMENIELDMIKNNSLITQINGGKEFPIIDSIFPDAMNIEMDTLINLFKSGPQNSMFQGEVERMEQQKTVVFNQKLPKLMAGYYQETILGTKLSGVRAGITIPLWENANAVKSAKANFVYAQTDAVRFWEQQEIEVRQLYEQWQRLFNQVEEMEELINNSNNDALLFKALENGEISLTQYYYEMDFYFQTKFDLIEFQRNLHFIEAELLSITYAGSDATQIYGRK